MIKKTKFWVILFSTVFVVCTAAFLIIRATGEVGSVAVVTVDGEERYRIDLSAVAAPYELRIDYDGGYNIIYVEHGRVSVKEADCRDQICVRQGSIDTSGIPIVCMPHRLVITIEGEP